MVDSENASASFSEPSNSETPDLTSFVARHRLAYRELYMNQTLNATDGEQLTLPAGGHFTDENGKSVTSGFPRERLIVIFQRKPRCLWCTPADSRLWSTNVIRKNRSGTTFGIIFVNPDLLRLDPIQRKYFLAEEWLEVMLGLQDVDLRVSQYGISSNDNYKQMLAHRQVIWQSSGDTQIELHLALRQLLVSSETLREVIKKEFSTSVEELKMLLDKQGGVAQFEAAVAAIEQFISTSKHIAPELVRDRLDEVLR